MNQDVAISLLSYALTTGATVMAPILLTGMLIGISVGALQAATQVNEPTLTFVPKVIGVGVVIAWLFPWGVDRMVLVVRTMIEGFSQVVQ
ncbi:MAG TPA: flagellar biosynthetic protein FliQ [Myxococcales bacterium LLY-WYZ-16_1]|nr:flagellar biosynthetic protein FliQ [Myxococcales bacterium LLY-WYZ-16_1]